MFSISTSSLDLSKLGTGTHILSAVGVSKQLARTAFSVVSHAPRANDGVAKHRRDVVAEHAETSECYIQLGEHNIPEDKQCRLQTGHEISRTRIYNLGRGRAAR